MSTDAASEVRRQLEDDFCLVRRRLPGLQATVDQVLLHTQGGAEPMQAQRLYEVCLVLDCARGEPKALEAFAADYKRGVRAAWRGLRIDDTEIAELWQALLIYLFVAEPTQVPRIATYRGSGALAGWVRITAVRFALGQRRGDGAHKNERLATVMLAARDASPELDLLEARYSSVFRECFREALGGLQAEARALLKQAFVHGMTARGLGTAYGLHHTSITRRLAKIRAELLTGTKDLLATRTGLAAADVDSVLAALHSRLDISFAQLRTETE